MYEIKLKILKTNPHTKNELSRLRLSNVGALQTDRHTDREWRRQLWGTGVRAT